MNRTDLRLLVGHVRRNLLPSLLNLIGLMVGLTAFILIALYVHHELSHDLNHPANDRLHRVYVEAQIGEGDELRIPAASSSVATSMKREVAGVEEFCRIWILGRKEPVQVADRQFMQEVAWADSTYFDLFSFSLAVGDEDEALARKGTAVLTRDMANTLFPGEDPMGREFLLNNQHRYTVTGILAPREQQSHITEVGILCSFATLERPDEIPFVNNNSYKTYVRLAPGVTPESLRPALDAMVERNSGEIIRSIGGKYVVKMQPIREAYLDNEWSFADFPSGSRAGVYQFVAIAVVILLIAGLNYVNLSTAVAGGRAKQVGVSKTLGAERSQLIRQFLMESVVLALIALVGAVLLAELLLPVFSNLAEKPLELSYTDQPLTLPLLVGLAVVIGLVSGIYPALFLSGFEPVKVLKGQLRAGAKGSKIRAALVIVQFSISVVLIVSTLVVKKQMDYVHDKHLGFDHEQLLVVEMIDDDVRGKWEVLRDEFVALPGVRRTASAHSVPMVSAWDNVFGIPEGTADVDELWCYQTWAGAEFAEAMGMELVEGRHFDPDRPSDRMNTCLINETFAREVGWDDPVGQQVIRLTDVAGADKKGEHVDVIGVVRDFHFLPLQQDIRPMVIFNVEYEAGPRYLLLQLNGEDVHQTMTAAEDIWHRLAPQTPFNYQFLDDAYDAHYRSEQRMGRLFTYFAALAIFIACLGLFALAVFAAQQRTKEIGVRKVLGASEAGIAGLLVREFAILVAIANLIGWPVAWLLMNRWLQDFAYRTSIGVDVFLITAAVTMTIALVTVSVQAIRAANTNPVRALRYE